MKEGKRSIFLIAALLFLFVVSCSGKEEKKEEAPAGEAAEKTLSYVSEDVSIGIFFDEQGTRRTIKLGRDQKEFTGYVIVHFPEYIEVAAVEWKLEMPEGVEIDTDKYRRERVMTLGQIEHGLSERFDPCLNGPMQVIHTLTFKVTGELKDATFSILPSENGEFVGVAECTEGYPQKQASAYRAVVNPSD